MSAKWKHNKSCSQLAGNRCSLRVHWASERKEWCVLVFIDHAPHHEYHYGKIPLADALRHARVLFNAIEGKA